MRPTPAPAHARWLALAPALFVVLWSSGFIGAKLGLPYAEPLTFLLLRFLLVVAIMLPAALLTRAPWPQGTAETAHIAVAGMLVQAGYLSGVFCAIHRGVPAGIVALIAGLQPILTALAAGPLLGERVNARQWTGFLLGIAGVAMVLSDKIAFEVHDWGGVALAVMALASITIGTLYQKRFCPRLDLRTGSVIQFSVSALLLGPLAYSLESMRIEWTGEFAFALAWLTLVLSCGAISLLFIMIRHGEAARVSSLFYLTPPATALIAFVVFNERLSLMALAGMGVAVAGVALVAGRRN
ncbi:MAG TPA: DMT family transporter [Burkholderiales bacterium]|nr:DMT family transporter [Burkholderiales bacterium]